MNVLLCHCSIRHLAWRSMYILLLPVGQNCYKSTTTQYCYSVDNDIHFSNTHRMHCCFSTQKRLWECDTIVHSRYTAFLAILYFHFCLHLPSIVFCSGLPAKFQKRTWGLQINTEQLIAIHNFKISLLVVVDETNPSTEMFIIFWCTSCA